MDRTAEAGILWHCFSSPSRAREVLLEVGPHLHEPYKSVARAILVMADRDYPATPSELKRLSVGAGMDEYDFSKVWLAMTEPAGALYMARDPEACRMAILRANELERRDSSLVRLEKARGDTEEYRNELERILEDLRATSPIMSLPPVETVEDLEMETIDAPLAVLGRGLLPASGLCFIHAASGIGKTLFALQLCAAISLGEPFFNWPTFPRRILYLQGELSRVWWQVRSRSLRAFMGRPLPDLLFAHESFPLMTFKGQTRATMAYSVLGFRKLRAMVEKHKADMVVIDPLSSYYELEENSTDQNREFQKRLLEFRRDTLTTVVLVHHDRKPQAFERSAMRGSSVLRDYADLSISIRKKPKSGPGVLTVSFDKTRHCAPPDDFYVLQTLQSFFIIHTPPRRKGKDVHEGTEKDVVEPEQYPLEEVEGGEPGEE